MIYSFELVPGVVVAYGDARSSVLRCNATMTNEFIAHQFASVYRELHYKIGAYNFLHLNQVHGIESYVISPENAHAMPQPFSNDADMAIVTTNGVAPICLTADCIPVVIAAYDGLIAVLLHAGWRGLASGIVSKATRQIRSIVGNEIDLVGWYGPHIRDCCYEVGLDVAAKFPEHAMKKISEDKCMLDLGAVVRDQFHHEAIALFPHAASLICVSCSKEFCSHRRSCGSLERNVTAVCLNGRPVTNQHLYRNFSLYR